MKKIFSFLYRNFSSWLSSLIRILGNAILYGMIFSTLLGSIGYAAMGTGFLDWIGGPWMMVTQDGDRNTFAGVDARAFHSRMNDSWFPYPGNYQNYIRGTTNFDNGDMNISGGNLNISNGKNLCLNGDCKTGWSNTPTLRTWSIQPTDTNNWTITSDARTDCVYISSVYPQWRPSNGSYPNCTVTLSRTLWNGGTLQASTNCGHTWAYGAIVLVKEVCQ